MNDHEPKFCSSCRQHKPALAGVYRKYAKGLKQRWVCNDCQARAEANKAKETR